MVSKGEVGALSRLGGLMVVVSGKGLWRGGKIFPPIFFLMWVMVIGSAFGMTDGVALGC